MRGHFGSRWELQADLLRLFLKKPWRCHPKMWRWTQQRREVNTKERMASASKVLRCTSRRSTRRQRTRNPKSEEPSPSTTTWMAADPETLARKTFMDSMEPEAHVNTILATGFGTPAPSRTPSSRRPSRGDLGRQLLRKMTGTPRPARIRAGYSRLRTEKPDHRRPSTRNRSAPPPDQQPTGKGNPHAGQAPQNPTSDNDGHVQSVVPARTLPAPG